MGLFGKGKINRQEQQSVKPQDVATDGLPECATMHVIADPCCVLADYSHFAGCARIPVALEKVTSGGCHPSVQIPKNMEVLNYLNSFRDLPVEFRKLPLSRTVMEYTLAQEYTITDKRTKKKRNFPGCTLWLLPTGYMIADNDWLSYMTPEIRKDIAKRVRTYKALSEQLVDMRNAQAVR